VSAQQGKWKNGTAGSEKKNFKLSAQQGKCKKIK